jgi:hypothetical protein
MFYEVKKEQLEKLSEVLELDFVAYEGTEIEDFDGDDTMTRINLNNGNKYELIEVGTCPELWEILEDAKDE